MFSAVSVDASTHSLFIQNIAILLDSLADASLFVPKNSSFWSQPSSRAVLTVFDTIWNTSPFPKVARNQVLAVLASLASESGIVVSLSHTGAVELILNCTEAVEAALVPLLEQLRQQTFSGNRRDFCELVGQYYNALLAGAKKHGGSLRSGLRVDECLSFEGTLPPGNLFFLTFFVRNSDIPELVEFSPNYEEWLSFFLQVVESIYKDDEDEIDRAVNCWS